MSCYFTTNFNSICLFLDTATPLFQGLRAASDTEVVFAGYDPLQGGFYARRSLKCTRYYSPYTWDQRLNVPSEGRHTWTVTFSLKGLRRSDKDTRDYRETNPGPSDESSMLKLPLGHRTSYYNLIQYSQQNYIFQRPKYSSRFLSVFSV